MKILMVVPALGDVYGGPSKSVLELTEAIGQLGVNIDLVTTNANGSHVLDVPLFTWIDKKTHRIQYFSYWNVADYKFTLSLTSWLFKNVANYQLVHTHAIFSYPVLPAYWAAQFHKIPYVVTPHGMLEPWALVHKGYKKQLYFSLLEKPSLQRASTIHMLATLEAKRIEPLALKTPLVVVPNGVHRHDFDKPCSAEVFYQKFPAVRHKTLIIFLGRIDPKKGLDLLAPAFAAAYSKFPETHLIIAGQDNIGFLPTAQSYFKLAGCADAVTFTGMLSGAVKYAALAAASIYVAPSYSEGFSMSVLEGMAAGLPCVITTGCNFPEAEEVSEIVDIDATQIGNALVRLLQNPERAESMGDRAREFILGNYTWDQVAGKLVAMYGQIINKKL